MHFLIKKFLIFIKKNVIVIAFLGFTITIRLQLLQKNFVAITIRLQLQLHVMITYL
jgi:hypothetical protein